MRTTDYQRVDAFKAVHNPSENAIFDEIQQADILDVIWEQEWQAAEYVTYAEDFVTWWRDNPEPTFDEILEKLTQMFAGMSDTDIDPNQMRHLVCKIGVIIYDQEQLPA